MIQAAIFDFDGTLVNTLQNIAGCVRQGLSSIGIEYHTPLEDFRYLVGDGADVLLHRLLQRHGRDNPTEFTSARTVFRQAYREDPVRNAEVYDGIPELLAKLKEQGVKLGVLTNKPHDAALVCTDRLFGTTFDCCLGQREGVPLKPDPAAGLEMLHTLCVPPAQAVYLGDTDVDMKTGKALGALTVGVLWGFRTREELISGGADLVIEHPLELLPHLKIQ